MIDALQDAKRAAGMLSPGLFVLTAAHEGRRSGVVARSVAWASDEPLLIAVFVKRGHWIEPVLRDSRKFAVCQVVDAAGPTMSLLLRRFAETSRPRDGDPFDGIDSTTLITGSPVLARSPLVLDCEVHRHFDLEADHEAYLGLVRAVRINGVRSVVAPPPPPPKPEAERRKTERRTRQRRKDWPPAQPGR